MDYEWADVRDMKNGSDRWAETKRGGTKDKESRKEGLGQKEDRCD